MFLVFTQANLHPNSPNSVPALLVDNQLCLQYSAPAFLHYFFSFQVFQQGVSCDGRPDGDSQEMTNNGRGAGGAPRVLSSHWRKCRLRGGLLVRCCSGPREAHTVSMELLLLLCQCSLSWSPWCKEGFSFIPASRILPMVVCP